MSLKYTSVTQSILYFTFFTQLKIRVFVMITVKPACQLTGQLSICGKFFNIAIFSNTINNKYKTLHDCSTHSALPIHTTFSDTDCSSRSQ